MGKIGIRRYQPSDATGLCEAVRESVNELSPWLAWCSPDYSQRDSETFLALQASEWGSRAHFAFAIHDTGSGRVLGGVGLNSPDYLHNFANLGYWVRTSATGRGLATIATRLAAQYGFDELGFQRLEILAAVDNVASQRVAEKAGALREGILRRRLLVHGVSQDAVLYSLIRGDLG